MKIVDKRDIEGPNLYFAKEMPADEENFEKVIWDYNPQTELIKNRKNAFHSHAAIADSMTFNSLLSITGFFTDPDVNVRYIVDAKRNRLHIINKLED